MPDRDMHPGRQQYVTLGLLVSILLATAAWRFASDAGHEVVIDRGVSIAKSLGPAGTSRTLVSGREFCLVHMISRYFDPAHWPEPSGWRIEIYTCHGVGGSCAE